MDIHGYVQISMARFGCAQISMYIRTPWNTRGVPWDAWDSHRYPWRFGVPRIPKICMDIHVYPRISLDPGFPGIRWVSGFPGIPRGTMGSQGYPWISSKKYGYLWNHWISIETHGCTRIWFSWISTGSRLPGRSQRLSHA